MRIVPTLAGALAALAAAAPASALAAAPSAADPARLLQLGGGLVLVVVLIAATALLLRRVLRIEPSGNGPLRVVAGLSMGTRERIVIVDADGQRLLLGIAPGRIQTLHVLGEAPPAAEAEPGAPRPRAGFARLLREARGGRGDGA